MFPKDIRDSIDKANDIVNGPWPPVWRHPVPSQADEVWDVLKPVRNRIEEHTGQPFQREPNETPESIVSRARDGAYNAVLGPGAVVPGPKI
jgi:hypothetical protein